MTPARPASADPAIIESMHERAGWAWLDGRLVAADEPQLTLRDRGFQLGDGVFETLRARRGFVVELAEHLARLRESAAVLDIALPYGDAALATAIERLLGAEGLADASLRITVSRGPLTGTAVLPADRSRDPTAAIQAWPFAPPADRLLREGVAAITSVLRRDPASPLTAVKTTSRADHVFARLEARRAGADDALHLTLDGRLAESTTANLFLASGGELLTPARGAGILPGTTRTWLLDQGELLGRRVREADLRPVDLLSADEAFLSASVSGIVPLVSLDGHPIGDGRPGALTLALRALRERWIDEAASQARGSAPEAAAGEGLDGEPGDGAGEDPV